MQLADIATKNIGEHALTPRMKCIMVRLDNWDRVLVQEGWQNIGWSMEQEFCMNRIKWVKDSIKYVWIVCRTLETVCSRKKQYFSEWKQCWRKTMYKYRK